MMLAGFRFMGRSNIYLPLWGIAWSQQTLRKASKNQGEIKEINKDLLLERPIKDEKENPISQEKLKTPQEILYGQQDQATKISIRRKVKVPIKSYR